MGDGAVIAGRWATMQADLGRRFLKALLRAARDVLDTEGRGTTR
jgi:hypothetical protein